MTFGEFFAQAGDCGPCVGILRDASAVVIPPSGVELRTVEGLQTRSVSALYDAFAEAWHFPPWFGRNASAFDDFMRDLDNMIEVAEGKPPAAGYFTHVTDAQLLLSDEPEAFSWFANCMPFYRDYYRDEAHPSAAFGLLLSASPDHVDAIRTRWQGVGLPVANVQA